MLDGGEGLGGMEGEKWKGGLSHNYMWLVMCQDLSMRGLTPRLNNNNNSRITLGESVNSFPRLNNNNNNRSMLGSRSICSHLVPRSGSLSVQHFMH